MIRITTAAALCALAASGGASAGGAPDLQPSIYAQLSFGHATSAPALHLGAQWSWSQRTLDGLARRLDPDAYRDPEAQDQARRSLREALPPFLHLDWSSAARFDARMIGASVLRWQPAVLRADGEESGGWSTGKTWATIGIVAGAGLTALLVSGGDDIKIGGSGMPDDSSPDDEPQGCTVVGGNVNPPDDVDPRVGEGCEDQVPGGG